MGDKAIDERNHPFTIIYNDLLTDESLSIYDTAVYIALCSFTDLYDQKCFPLVCEIANRAKCGERQVRLSLKTLEERGLIRREHCAGYATIYHIMDTQHITAPYAGLDDPSRDMSESISARAAHHADYSEISEMPMDQIILLAELGLLSIEQAEQKGRGTPDLEFLKGTFTEIRRTANERLPLKVTA
jgi:predicted transcriptional regulator